MLDKFKLGYFCIDLLRLACLAMTQSVFLEVSKFNVA